MKLVPIIAMSTKITEKRRKKKRIHSHNDENAQQNVALPATPRFGQSCMHLAVPPGWRKPRFLQ